MTTFRWFIVLLAGFILCALRLATRDFYSDELVTLDNYLFCPLYDVVTVYVKGNGLNNHVLYSLLNNAYLKLIGVTEIETILRHPWILRLPQLVFPIGTLWLVWRFGKENQ